MTAQHYDQWQDVDGRWYDSMAPSGPALPQLAPIRIGEPRPYVHPPLPTVPALIFVGAVVAPLLALALIVAGMLVTGAVVVVWR